MDKGDSGSEAVNGLHHIFAHGAEATLAEGYPGGRTGREVHSLRQGVRGGHNAADAPKLGNRRIVGVETHANSGILSCSDHAADEVFVVVPDLVA